MAKKKYMEIIDKNGNSIKYEILISFLLNNKQYIIYTDNTYNVKKQLNVYAAIYNPLNDIKLEKIESEIEMQIVASQIKKLLKDVNI